MNNKQAGTEFERSFADILAENWFWVHLFQGNKNGQPCDVVAARNGHTYLFDCKNCEKDYFLLSRMEENQYNAMHLFELAGNSRGKFAIRFSDEQIYLIDYWQIHTMREAGKKRIDRVDLNMYGEDFFAWLRNRNAIDGWGGEWGEKDACNHWQ